jgi:hypothetical protein
MDGRSWSEKQNKETYSLPKTQYIMYQAHPDAQPYVFHPTNFSADRQNTPMEIPPPLRATKFACCHMYLLCTSPPEHLERLTNVT